MRSLKESILSSNSASAWCKPVFDVIFQELEKVWSDKKLNKFIIPWYPENEIKNTILSDFEHIHKNSQSRSWKEPEKTCHLSLVPVSGPGSKGNKAQKIQDELQNHYIIRNIPVGEGSIQLKMIYYVGSVWIYTKIQLDYLPKKK